MNIEVTSAVGFNARLNLHVLATNRTGDTEQLERTLAIPAGSPAYPSVNDFNIPLHRLLTFGADQLSLVYDIAISGQGMITAGSYACGTASIATPLRLALSHDTIDLGGRVVEIDQGTRDKIARYLVAGEVCADVGNHFPLGMNACVVLRPDSQSQGATGAVSIPVRIPAGQVNQDRSCQSASDTSIVGAIDDSSLTIFHNPKIYAHLLLYIPDTDTVEIRDQDFLHFVSRAVLKLKVGG